MKKTKKLTGLLIYTFILFFSITGFIYASNSQQISSTGGSADTNTAGEKDGVEVSKIISPSDTENFFDITLTVTTNSKIEEIIKDPDLAIVIVMDISNTMVTNNVTSGESRLDSAQAAAEMLIDEFVEYSRGVNAVRELGFVSFNTNSKQIFALQDCVTSTKKAANNKATSLKDEMNTETDAIVNQSGYNGSYKRFTNIESGLKRAKNMLSKSNVKNKYIIFLSDGLPTTYIKSDSTYNGYNPYMSSEYNSDFDASKTYTKSTTGVFYNEFINQLTTIGTDYSDRAAIKARKMATSIKNQGITIFSVGVGINSDRTIDKNSSTVDVDKETYNENGGFETGSTGKSFKKWLKNSIGSGYYYDTNDTTALKEAYLDIFNKVKEETEKSLDATWVAEDPMGEKGANIEFLGFYNDDSLQSTLTYSSQTYATYKSNKISWDLKLAPVTETFEEDGVTYYKYIIKYRVRLKNELNTFDTTKIYVTNDKTTLSYVVRNDGVISDEKYIDFPIPSVVGYLGSLSFTKKSAFDGAILSGAKFKLSHDPDCTCHDGYINLSKNVSIEDTYATSTSDGLVSFTNIPSGHTYILTETEAPTDHELSTKEYKIKVAYGQTTGGPTDGILENEISKANLEIKKTVKGNTDKPGKFKFTLNVYFKDTSLNGKYKYIINKTDEGTIEFVDGKATLELGASDSMIIYDLPVGTTYKLKETTTDGYKVQYEVNSTGEKTGTTATCQTSNSCRLEKGSNNLVEFINTAAYILPATGSSGMLIVIIIGALLLIVPVIYIGYSIYQGKRRRA